MRIRMNDFANAWIWRWLVLCLIIACIPASVLMGQGFLHADGKRIVDGNGENVILRGIGTGNWMLQEGYMMKTSDIAGTHHEFREKLIQTIGEPLTDSFYTVWLENHFTRTDVDSMASWGFNSVRVAMHYKWFTIPIEEDTVAGEQTWLQRGFEMIDSLLDWCGDNEMYLILDLHGAPGGQGKDAAISDYDPSKPSLWESQKNQDKTVALWKKLAERYSDEPWIGGYDLINETNWPLGSNNGLLRSLYGQITDSIRTVDPNHMIFIEGNGFANDFRGLTPPFDPNENMAYSFHKYATYNTTQVLDWVLDIRNTYNVPIWLGECGENSNTWHTNLVHLCESENIGWSMWPVKKEGINNPLLVEVNDDYLQLVDNWRGDGPFLSEEEAFQAVLTFADNHRIENCHFQKDVVDAMIRQPYTTETVPFLHRTVNDTIFSSDYDMGRNGYAWFDKDTATYHFGGEDFTAWNTGWSYRNDGVDVESCNDTPTNGYSVGWTDQGEWLNYTLLNDSAAIFSMEIRSASDLDGGQIHVEVNGADASGTIQLPATGGWYRWATTKIDNIILPAGTVQVKIVFEGAGSNLNYFRFFDPQPYSSLDFAFVSAKTAELENEVYISLNKEVTSPASFSFSDFTLTQGGIEVEIESVELSGEDERVLVIASSGTLFYDQSIGISYTGNSIYHDEQPLAAFNSETVQNLMARHFTVPGRIQAEDFYLNNGLVLESCSDVGGGQNTGYAHPGDYLEYVLYVEEPRDYALNFRIASERGNAALALQVNTGEGFETLNTMNFTGTGGWQNWTTQSTGIHLEQGKYLFRLLVTGAEHNLNWFEFLIPVNLEQHPVTGSFNIFPNPASGQVTLKVDAAVFGQCRIEILDSSGRMMYNAQTQGTQQVINTSGWAEGIYFVRLINEKNDHEVQKLVIR